MTDPMEFDPSVDDEEKYSKVIAPFFLNALNIMTGSKIGSQISHDSTRCGEKVIILFLEGS